MSDGAFRQHFTEALRQTSKFGGWIFIALAQIYLASGIYIISQNQVGVLERCGKVVNRSVQPGIHYALPWPIYKVNKVPIKIMRRISIEDFHDSSYGDTTAGIFYSLTGLSSYCITGDNNLVNLVCVIQYNITDPLAYLFGIKENERVLHEIAASSIIHVLAGKEIDKALTHGKFEIQNEIHKEIKNRLEDLESGITVSFIEAKSIQPPSRVQQAFEDVINSKIDKKKMINQAESYQNQKIPDAHARATSILERANGYYNRIIAEAEGETSRFSAVYTQYQKAHDVTRTRIYLETLDKILSKVDKKYLIDKDKKGEAPRLKLFLSE